METGEIIALASLGVAVIVAPVAWLQYFRPGEKAPAKETNQTAHDNQNANQFNDVNGPVNIDQRTSDPDVIEAAVAGATRGIQQELVLKSEELEKAKKERDAAIEDLEAYKEKPDAPLGIDEAVARYRASEDSEAAEDIFQQILDAKKAEGATAYKEAAAAARHIGALAFLHDTEKALKAYRQAVDLDPDDPDGWNQLGRLFKRVGQLEEAEIAYSKLFDLGKGIQNKKFKAVAYGNIANLYQVRRDLKQALELNLKSLKLNEEIGDRHGTSGVLMNIGLIHQTIGEFEQAKEFYEKSIKLQKELGKRDGLGFVYGNLGVLQNFLGEIEKAEEMFKLSLNFCKEFNNKEGLANAYGNLGSLNLNKGFLDIAESMFKKSMEIDAEIGRKEGLANNYGDLANLYFKKGNFDQAAEMYSEALVCHDELGNKEGLAICQANIGQLVFTGGDLDPACKHWQKSLLLFEEIDAPHMVEQVRGLMAEAGCSVEEE